MLPNTGFSIQGALNLFDAVDPEASGSFLCLDKSHLEMKKRFDEGVDAKMHEKVKSHYVKFPEDHYFYAKSKQEPALAIAVKAGDYVVWDSALVHSNFPPIKNTIINQLRRLVAYVACAPVSHFPTNTRISAKKPQLTLDQFRKARRDACAQGWTTSHWSTAVPKNNRAAYPRHASFTQFTTPASCKKTAFSSEEDALLSGCKLCD